MLYERRYRTVTLLETGEYLSQARPFPDSVLVLTFDDGYLRSNWLFDMKLTGLFPRYVKVRSIPRHLRDAFQLGPKR